MFRLTASQHFDTHHSLQTDHRLLINFREVFERNNFLYFRRNIKMRAFHHLTACLTFNSHKTLIKSEIFLDFQWKTLVRDSCVRKISLLVIKVLYFNNQLNLQQMFQNVIDHNVDDLMKTLSG